MNKQNTIFKKKELVLAVSIAMLGGAMTGCSSDGDSSGPGGYTINATGGNGYRGGNGYHSGMGAKGIEIYNNGGTGGVVVSTSGKANTDFTSPIIAGTANLGDNPLEITADTTIDDMAALYTPVADGYFGLSAVTPNSTFVGTDDVLYLDGGDGYAGAAGYAGYAVPGSDDTIVSDDSYYLSSGDNELYQAVGGDNVADVAAADTLYMGSYGGLYVADGYAGAADPRISGIYVAANKTLTLGVDSSGSNTYINVDNDIDNRGTITKTNPGDNSILALNPHHYLGGGKINNAGNVDRRNGGEVHIGAESITTGDINVSGYDDKSGVDAGNGGSFAGYGGAYVLSNGNIDASGGDVNGEFAGHAGSVHMYAAYVENNGNIDISGGNDTSDGAEWGLGGDGGTVRLAGNYVTNNTGDIDASGGDGGEGGRGGNINFFNSEIGEVKNAGNINLSGGSADDGHGGFGGSFDMYTVNGDTLNSGNINAAGGSTTDSGSEAGRGGDIEIYTTEGGEFSDPTGTGDVVVSGNLDVSGGDATAGTSYGGDAGSIEIYNELGYGGAHDQRVALLGYKAINANGGDGTYAGDGAGYNNEGAYGGVVMYADSSLNTSTNEVTFGSVSNEVAINASGGNGSTSGNSGHGGSVTLAASGNDYSGYGGYGGYGGPVGLLVSGPVSTPSLVGDANVTNSGAINVSGGDGGEFGGSAGDTELLAYGGMAINSGAVEATGGKGDDFGGRGGSIEIGGADTATNQAALSVDGGNGVLIGGGDGGNIAVMAMNPINATSSGNITYSFGIGGETNGDEGCAIIGLNQLGSCNMMLK